MKEANKNLSRAAAEDRVVYADHISIGPSPHGTVDLSCGVPDLVVKSGSQNSLLVEVKTAAPIGSNPTHATNQLAGFRKQGYCRAIVLPATDSNSDTVTEWIDAAEQELDGELVAARSDTGHNLLWFVDIVLSDLMHGEA